MLERLILAVVLMAAGWLLYRLYIHAQKRRAAAALPGLAGREVGKYLILYFTSPTCAACRSAQRPALERVQQQFGAQLQIIMVDVQEQPEAAAHWGVMTLPTTYLFHPDGQAAGCNPGVTYADTLARQISAMGANPQPA